MLHFVSHPYSKLPRLFRGITHSRSKSSKSTCRPVIFVDGETYEKSITISRHARDFNSQLGGCMQMQSAISPRAASTWQPQGSRSSLKTVMQSRQRNILRQHIILPVQCAARRSDFKPVPRLMLETQPKPHLLNEKEAALGVPMHPIRVRSLSESDTWLNIPACTNNGKFLDTCHCAFNGCGRSVA